MSKKDKGKGIQMDDDYKIVRTKNSFQSLAKFPPLPYKTIVTKAPTKPSRDNYILRYTEHLFLTSYKVSPTNLFIKRLGSTKLWWLSSPWWSSSKNSTILWTHSYRHPVSWHYPYRRCRNSFLQFIFETPYQECFGLPAMERSSTRKTILFLFWTRYLQLPGLQNGLAKSIFSQTRDSFLVL